MAERLLNTAYKGGPQMSAPHITKRANRFLRVEYDPFQEDHPGVAPLTRVYFEDGSSSIRFGDHLVSEMEFHTAGFLKYSISLSFEDSDLTFRLTKVSSDELYWLMRENSLYYYEEDSLCVRLK